MSISLIARAFISFHSELLLAIFYKNSIWNLRDDCKRKPNQRYKEYLYYTFLRKKGAWIGLKAEIASPPILPHGLHGIFISNKAVIGKDVVIFHQVTIGSNTIKNSNTKGAPSIGDNCYIGCGAKIIGGVSLGTNVRVGANCIVTKDVPSNSVCVMRGMDIIQKEGLLDNTFIPEYY